MAITQEFYNQASEKIVHAIGGLHDSKVQGFHWNMPACASSTLIAATSKNNIFGFKSENSEGLGNLLVYANAKEADKSEATPHNLMRSLYEMMTDVLDNGADDIEANFPTQNADFKTAVENWATKNKTLISDVYQAQEKTKFMDNYFNLEHTYS